MMKKKKYEKWNKKNLTKRKSQQKTAIKKYQMKWGKQDVYMHINMY